MFEQMLTDRLQACEDTYKSEFNNLMKQFEDMRKVMKQMSGMQGKMPTMPKARR
jgi:signal recognition particle GTPase